jgi:hypothetical protein
MRSCRERPGYRGDLLARTNVMTAWPGEACLARSGACLTADEQDHGLVVYVPPGAVRVATGKGGYHESTFAGAGVAYVRGQVLTADGRLLASFAQDAMIRALAGPAASVPSASRL